MTVKIFPLLSWLMPHKTPRQTRQRRSPFPYAPDAAPSRNLAKLVVAVAEVLGSETAEVLVTPSLITRGTRASRSVKHGQSPK